MNQQAMPNLTLFDLLARNWRRPAPVSHLCFNDDDTLLAISSVDGAVALARIADNEPPESRIKAEDGQTTIHPREGKPSPLISTRIQQAGKLSAYEGGEFLILTATGDLIRVGRSGEIAAKVMADKSPIVAFAHCRSAGLTATIVHQHLRLQSGSGVVREVDLADHRFDRLCLSGDGSMIALAGPEDLVIRRTDDDHASFSRIALPSRSLSLKWSADGRWLVCGLETTGLCLIDVVDGRHVLLGDFPGSVRALDWSQPANAFFASGAYRIAGWSMESPPFFDSASGAIATGHAGFVMVGAVAAHPVKRLVAAGNANGRIVVARIGSPEELVVRDDGGPVTALQWSADGRHLGVGDALGNAAIITFPDAIFK